MRWVLLYTYQFNTSERQIDRLLPGFLLKGEKLVPDLYADLEEIREESKRRLDKAIELGKNLMPASGTPAMHSKYKQRKFWSRVRNVSVPVISIGLTMVGLLGLGGLNSGVSVVGVSGILVSLLIFWMPHVNIMQMTWVRISNSIADRLKKRLTPFLGTTDSPIDQNWFNQVYEQSKFTLAVRNGKDNLRKELNKARAPNIDLIVIYPEDADKVGDLKSYAENRRGSLIREDIPVVIIPSRTKGSGKAYFESVKYVRNQWNAGAFNDEFPHIRDKAWEDARVMFVYHGKDVEDMDKVLDWSIVNGYSMSESMQKRSKRTTDGKPDKPEVTDAAGGHIIIYSRDAYFGPIQRVDLQDDVTLLGYWANESSVSGLGLLNLESDSGDVRVREIFEKLSIDELEEEDQRRIHRSKILRYLQENFDLGNEELRQYPALSGLMVFGPRTVRLLGAVIDQIEQDTKLWDELEYLHMTNDILNVLLKPDDEMQDYTNTRTGWKDMHTNYSAEKKKTRKILQRFYKLIRKAKSDINADLRVRTMMPYFGSAELIQLKDPDDIRRISGLLDQAIEENMPVRAENDDIKLEADEAMLGQQSAEYGGLDFSGAADSILFQQPDPLPDSVIPTPSMQNIAPPSLQMFKGFGFKILKLEPMENTTEFLSAAQ